MKKLMYIAAALLVLVGCNKKENVIENAPQNLVTITGGIELPSQDGPNKAAAKPGWETATTGSTIEFVWEEGDVIAVVSADQEIKKFTVSKILEEGKKAEFTGEPLSGGMEEQYTVYYPYEFGEAFLNNTPEEWSNSQQYTGKLNPAGFGEGENNSFVINTMLLSVIDLPLKGNVKLGKIKYSVSISIPGNSSTVLFGEEGLQLTDEPQHVTFAIGVAYNGVLKLSFYDTENQLIMEKEVEKDLLDYADNTIISFPTLEVKAAAPTTTPTLADVLEDDATFEFGITLDGYAPTAYDFAYKNQNETFICTKVFREGADVTAVSAQYCSVLKDPSKNLFTFNFGDEDQNIIFDADNNSYAISEMLVTDFNLTSFDYFKVNGVDITSTLINETVYE